MIYVVNNSLHEIAFQEEIPGSHHECRVRARPQPLLSGCHFGSIFVAVAYRKSGSIIMF